MNCQLCVSPGPKAEPVDSRTLRLVEVPPGNPLPSMDRCSLAPEELFTVRTELVKK
jgi:hypothetical protein